MVVEINKLSKKACLLLAMIHLSDGSMRGTTRMQKMALLISKDINQADKTLPAFSDWVADDFGGRSVQVYQAKDELAMNQMLTEREVTVEGKKMKVYDLTSFGREAASQLPLLFGLSWSQIVATTKKYSQAQTADLVALSYQRFPDLTINSKIKPEVNMRLLKNSSPLSPLYDEDVGGMPPSSLHKRKQELKDSASDEQFFKRREFEMQKLPDLEARKKMAAIMGLNELPKLDPYAIYRLDGILGKQLPKDKKFDSVELVRSVRGD